MPEGIFAFEAAVHGDNVAALFLGGFSGMDGYVVQLQVVPGEQRAFALISFVLYLLHFDCYFTVFNISSIFAGVILPRSPSG